MSDITLLDGSIGQELVRRSGDRATPLWSTSVMMHKPDLVRQVHDAYFAARKRRQRYRVRAERQFLSRIAA